MTAGGVQNIRAIEGKTIVRVLLDYSREYTPTIALICTDGTKVTVILIDERDEKPFDSVLVKVDHGEPEPTALLDIEPSAELDAEVTPA